MSRCIVGATWDDAPHLTPEMKEARYASIPPYQRAARMRGVPQLGAGAVYPIAEETIRVDPFKIPRHWPRGCGQDVGWRYTAGAWLALDPSSGVRYLYSVYRGEEKPPIEHLPTWRARGLWIPVRIDPAAKGRSQVDGRQLIKLYREVGFPLTEAMNAVEAGVGEMWTLLNTGKLKIFASCAEFFEEYRMYIRDEMGHIKKGTDRLDHVLDATRYANAEGVSWWEPTPDHWRDDGLLLDTIPEVAHSYTRTGSGGSGRWMM